MLLTPGWNIAVALPATAYATISSHSGGLLAKTRPP